MKTPKKELCLVEKINAKYKVGDKIKVRQDDGEILEWTMRHEATILGTHSAVIWAKECVGCYCAHRLVFSTRKKRERILQQDAF